MLRYLLGAGELAAVAAALAYGATGWRAALLSNWSGAPARLAEVVLATSALLLVGEVLGSVGLFREVPVLVAVLALGLGSGYIARRRGSGVTSRLSALPPPAVPTRLPAIATAIALGACLLVGIHWATFVGYSLDHGMWQSDSTWHNGPFAAIFFQTGWVSELHQTDPLTFMPWFYPQNPEVLNAVALLFFHNDFPTVFANLAWLAVAALGAWCIGRPFGVAPLSLLGALVVLDANCMLTSQPGELKTDIMGIAFLLAAVGLIVNFWPTGVDRRALVVSGLAAGLAIGSKYTLLPVVGVLTIGLLAFAWRRAWWFVLGMATTGSYWYLRSIVVSGSPLPQRRIDLGFVQLGTPQLPIDAYPPFSIADYLTNTAIWGTYFGPGMQETFGHLWWIVIGLALLGAALAVTSRGSRILQVAGAAVIAAGVAYLVTPTTAGGEEGMPKAFVWNVRYAVPPLVVGLALLPALPRFASRWKRWSLLGVLLAVLLVTDSPTRALQSEYALQAAIIVALLAAIPMALALARRSGASIAAVVAGLVCSMGLAVGLGREEQRQYLRDKYTDTYPRHVHNRGLAAAIEWFQSHEVEDSRVGIVGGTASNREYTFFGDDLSNRVQYIGLPGPRGAFYPIRDCLTWRKRVNAGNYDFLVVSQRYVPHSRYLLPTGTEAAWTRSDPNARAITFGERVATFRLLGKLDPAGCKRLATSATLRPETSRQRQKARKPSRPAPQPT